MRIPGRLTHKCMTENGFIEIVHRVLLLISRLFAAQDKVNVSSAVILDEIYQREESFFIGKPLDGRNIEHIRLPSARISKICDLISSVNTPTILNWSTPGIKFKFEPASHRYRICPASPTPSTVARSPAFSLAQGSYYKIRNYCNSLLQVAKIL